MQIPSTPPIFKYMKSYHASRFLLEGTLRVGTLSEYRNTELHGNRIGDQEEGRIGHFEHVVEADGSTLSAFARTIVGAGPGAAFSNCTFVRSTESPDCFIFSAASTFSTDLMKEFGYDACIRINEPLAFLSAMSLSLQNVAKFEGLFPCVYTQRFVAPDIDHGAHPALVKDPDYESQKEVRAIWLPISGQPTPRVLRCKRAIRYCSRVA